MGNIAILSTDHRPNQAILQACADFGDEFVPVYLRDKSLIVQYLNYELPEIIVVNCSDKYIKLKAILKEIKGDPWLYSGGFVLLHEEESEQELLKSFAGSNLLANFLFNANLVDMDGKVRFYVALMELLINAIEHGNCRISYEEKSAWL